jgi:hypothetical protein
MTAEYSDVGSIKGILLSGLLVNPPGNFVFRCKRLLIMTAEYSDVGSIKGILLSGLLVIPPGNFLTLPLGLLLLVMGFVKKSTGVTLIT